MLAVTLGANAAMEIGSEKKALQYYQSVLKYDPDQKQIREQYRGLKKVIKLLKNAEKKLEEKYNKQAMELIDECLSAVRGLDVDSPLFRSIIQLKLCKVQSALRMHEESIETCDAVVSARTTPIPGVTINPALMAEAYIARAETRINDFDYDGARTDFQSALEHIPEGGEQDMQIRQRLREVEHLRSEWNGGEKTRRYNEHTGYPDGKPPQRDNIKILDLPVNLDESAQEIKCKWLKKQYKKMTLKWHPDKYKGNAERGARKMREVNEAKVMLAKEWGCKGGRGRG